MPPPAFCSPPRSALIWQRSRRVRAAYTLVDLVITTLIVGILAAVASPRYAEALSRFRVQAAAQRVAADLRLVQREAEAASAQCMAQFSFPASHEYDLKGIRGLDRTASTYQVDLAAAPYHAKIVAVDFGGNSALIVNGFGKPASDGKVVLSCGGFQKTVLVIADTGRVEVQ